MSKTVKVLKLDSHKGTATTSFFCYAPKDGKTLCIAKANRGGIKQDEEVAVADLLKLQVAKEDQIKRFNSVKASGVDTSLLG